MIKAILHLLVSTVVFIIFVLKPIDAIVAGLSPVELVPVKFMLALTFFVCGVGLRITDIFRYLLYPRFISLPNVLIGEKYSLPVTLGLTCLCAIVAWLTLFPTIVDATLVPSMAHHGYVLSAHDQHRNLYVFVKSSGSSSY